MGSFLGALLVGIIAYFLATTWQKNYLQRKKEEKEKRIKQLQSKYKSSSSGYRPYIPPKKEVDITIPEWKDGAERYNCYTVKIKVTDEETIRKNAEDKEWMLDPVEIDGEIHVFSCGVDVGILLDRVEMLQDWIKRDDPYFFCLERLSSEKGCTGCLAFYKDKRKGQDWREQTVTPLISYKSDSKQSAIFCIHEGAELKLGKDHDHKDSVYVFHQDSCIGKLSKEMSTRYLDEGAYGVFFEKREYDKDYKDKPFVRIFWKKDRSAPSHTPKYNLVDANTIVPQRTDFDESHPLYKKNIIITGALSIPREAAMQAAAEAGAILKNDISQKIDYLVVGEKDPMFCDENGLSAKERKAKKLIDSGKGHIKIISNEEFMKLLYWKPEG